MTINPIVYTEKVVKSFLRYQITAYPFADPGLYQQMRELLSLDETRRSPLLKGPYLSLSRPFRRGARIRDLVGEGVLHPLLAERVPPERSRLFGHQEKAIRAVTSGRTTLVSTGTGSGKTECFLYPIISRCLELRDQGAPPGISAVIVYPMKRVARSLRTHRDLILNWFKAKAAISAGIVEGLNANAKLTTRKSRGFRTANAAKIALYHALGDLPEPEYTHRFC